MKVAVCDDNKVMLEYISRKVDDNLMSLDVVHEISGFERSKDFISQHEKTPFDVVFLDIKMPDIDGFEVAKMIRKLSDNTQIVFITTEDGLVYDSFDYQPFCFIPKTTPEILKVKLETVIKKIVDKLEQNRKICLKLPHGEERYIYTNSILYICSHSNYLNIIRESETICIREKIADFFEKMPQQMFVRIHNRYIVNLQQIAAVDCADYKIIMKNEEILYVSRAYKSSFLKNYNLFQRKFT